MGRGIRIRTGELQPHPPGRDSDPGADLQKFQPNRGTLDTGELRAFGVESLKFMHQYIGEREEVQPQLVCTHRVRAGTVGKQVELLLLDTVLRFVPDHH